MKILITGASSGIGRDMALLLAKSGHHLILTARRKERLEEIRERYPRQVRVISADLSQKEECFRLYRETADEKIDVLINNAGFGLCGEFCRTDLDTELNMIQTNLTAVHILTKLFVRDFVRRDHGYILNVASSAAFLPGPLMASYYATKAYVLRLSQAVGEELRKRKSRVFISVLCPGPVRTEFSSTAQVKFHLNSLSSEYVAKYALEKLFERKALIIPGAGMKLLKQVERLAPEQLLLRVAYYIQSRKSR